MIDKVQNGGREYQAVIFDLYGTLIDLPQGQGTATVEMANILGIETDIFQVASRRLREQRDLGQFTVEAAIEATMDSLDAVAAPQVIQTAEAVRYRSVREAQILALVRLSC